MQKCIIKRLTEADVVGEVVQKVLALLLPVSTRVTGTPGGDT